MTEELKQACQIIRDLRLVIWEHHSAAIMRDEYSTCPACQQCAYQIAAAEKFLRDLAGREPNVPKTPGGEVVGSKEVLSVAIAELVSRRGLYEIKSTVRRRHERYDEASEWSARAAGLGEAIQVIQNISDAATDNAPHEPPRI